MVRKNDEQATMNLKSGAKLRGGREKTGAD